MKTNETYENFGDVDFLEYGGKFSKKINEGMFHVILLNNISQILGLDYIWYEVKHGYIDISEFNRIEEINKSDIYDKDEVNDNLLAVIIMENYDIDEFGYVSNITNMIDLSSYLDEIFVV